MHDDELERRHEMALLRYQMISPYLALNPPRGKRRELLEQLASTPLVGPDGTPLKAEAETLRSWVRRYRRNGLPGLMDKERPQRGVQVLTPAQVETVLSLKREVPERSLDRIIRIAEETGMFDRGVLTRSTLHRVLQREGISRRPASASDPQDLDRFEALASNDLWQSDARTGPWLPDPDRPNKARRTKLFSYVDDHSRKLLHGRFNFSEALPDLELVFRRCLQKYGKPARVYYDRGKVYRADHMRHIVATLGIHAIVYTTAYRPEGHGKIEAFNRLAKAAFVAEVKASKIRTLDELNEAFAAWMDLEYNRRVHSETGQTPDERFAAGLRRVEYIDEKKMRLAFRWREQRTPDKSGLFSLMGTRYQVGPQLARRRIDVYFDPEDLSEVEVHLGSRFIERCRPFEVHEHRRPQAKNKEPAAASQRQLEFHGDDKPPTADWLGHLVSKRQKECFVASTDTHDTAQQDDQLVALLREQLDPAVFDEASARDFLRRYGPFDPQAARQVLCGVIAEQHRNDHHIHTYLDAIRQALR